MKYRFNLNGELLARPWGTGEVLKIARRVFPTILALALIYFGGESRIHAQSLNSILAHARTTTAPASGKFKPDDNVHPFAASNRRTSLAVRTGRVRLSDGRTIFGQVWTTMKTPFRIWLADIKQYRDIDIRLIKKIQVHILAEKEIRNWRFQQEGSDIKNYSDQTRPRISFAYTFTLLNGNKITGTLDAPLYVRAHGHTTNLIIYKRVEGKIGEKISAVNYVKSVTLTVTPAIRHYAASLTRTLPLIHWRRMLAGGHKSGL